MVESNPLETWFLSNNTKKQNKYDTDDEYDSEEDLGECDPNGDVAICEDCSKVIPKSKLAKHKEYFCKHQMAECPLCHDKYPMMMIDDHMTHCQKINRDPNMITCNVCQA